MMEMWQVVLVSLACGLAVVLLLCWSLSAWSSAAYQRLVRDNTVSVDDFVGGGAPGFSSRLKVLLLHSFNSTGFTGSPGTVPLTACESDKVPGLMVTKRDDSGTGLAVSKEPPLVVGTIRMGFGHHRIAYATTSWGLHNNNDKDKDTTNGRPTFFHDLLNVESPEAHQIHSVDQKYSKGSRLASEWGGVVEAFWGSLTKSGDEDSLRVTYQWGELLKPILTGLDKNSPVIATHSLVANAAVACGFKNVVNLVIDNHAQWFVVVPGALNLVQGPSNYHAFLKMGVPAKDLMLAGHWIPKDLVEGIPSACRRRIKRAQHTYKKPLRILVPVGGAGAQRKFIVKLVEALAPYVRREEVQLFLNAADHEHMKTSFIAALTNTNLTYDTVDSMQGVRAFKDRLLSDQDNAEPAHPVTLFTYDDYFTAVATTDILCNVADVLACKPSELAFYPIPKLMIRRVGDHEAYSALRASELGDGTLECRTLDECVRYVDLFLTAPELLTTMNEAIAKNNTIGLYDGCKNAVRIALERQEALRSSVV